MSSTTSWQSTNTKLANSTHPLVTLYIMDDNRTVSSQRGPADELHYILTIHQHKLSQLNSSASDIPLFGWQQDWFWTARTSWWAPLVIKGVKQLFLTMFTRSWRCTNRRGPRGQCSEIELSRRQVQTLQKQRWDAGRFAKCFRKVRELVFSSHDWRPQITSLIAPWICIIIDDVERWMY